MSELWLSSLGDKFRFFCGTTRESLYIICPFIRLGALQHILHNFSSLQLVVITTWDILEIVQGYSDLNIYPWLKERGAYLYINPLLHAKILIKDSTSAILSTANITQTGLGVGRKGNIEAAILINSLSLESRAWLHQLILDSIYVQDSFYEKIKLQVSKHESIKLIPEGMEMEEERDCQAFLISNLPMSESPIALIERCQKFADGIEAGLDKADVNCALHDIALYKLNIADPSDVLVTELKKQFLAQPFICALSNFIVTSRFFGEVKEWVQLNCANVPVPKRRDLTQHIQILFAWLSFGGFNAFYLDRPNYSTRINRIISTKL